MNRQSWWERINCANVDPATFEPARGPERRRWGRARAVCAACPVQKQCLAFVLRQSVTVRATVETAYVAGHTPREIHQLRLAAPPVTWDHHA